MWYVEMIQFPTLSTTSNENPWKKSFRQCLVATTHDSHIIHSPSVTVRPWKVTGPPKRKVVSKHHFSGVNSLLNFGGAITGPYLLIAAK